MKNSKKLFAVILALCLIVTSAVVGSIPAGAEEETAKNTNDLLMWYDKPVSTSSIRPNMAGSVGTGVNDTWQQLTLPIGNGYMGGSVYGEISTDRILLNEESLWTGGPSTSRSNYKGGNLDQLDYAETVNGATTKVPASTLWKNIVDDFASGDATRIARAKYNCKYLKGAQDGYGSYQPFADLYLDFGINANNVANYRRTLDLKTAVATVEFDYNNAHYTREYFMSYPYHVMVVKLTTDAKDGMDVTARLVNEALSTGSTVTAEGDTVTLKGQLTDNQMSYNGKIKVIPDNNSGTLSTENNGVKVSGTKSVTMYLSLSTNYANDYGKNYRTELDKTDEENETRIEKAATDGYQKVHDDHITDYQKLFNRVKLDLGQVPSDKPTNELLTAYNDGSASEELRRGLEVMLFQYGRYLTIASSREGTLPSNLQGVWNNNTDAAWGSDYHINVNLQMNYWPTYSTNLAECAKPLVDYVDSLREPGRVTASTYFGIDNSEGKQNGFTANTQNTIFGWTCPGWEFSWGWSPAAVPWILQNCYEYYEYTSDENYLKENIYPMMVEECKFYDQILKKIGNRWVTAPSYSPEHGPYTAGNTYESTLVWQLFNDTIIASEILDEQDEETLKLIESIKGKMKDLDPIQVGDSGQIKEWFDEEEGELGKTGTGAAIGNGYQSGHRHLSHLLGLFPGDLIQTNDEWVEAAKVSITNRGDDATGWGVGQRINTWARLRDGDHALLLIEKMFQSAIYPNLWDAHPPFQIDGNFGMTSGVAEMLLQSNMGFVDILPALPTEWDEGSVSGLVARGNFEVTTSWKNGIATEIKITSNEGEKCVVGYDDFNDNPQVVDKNGETVQTTKNDKGQIEFNTEKGATYTITGFKLPTVHNAEATYYPNNTVDITWDELEDMNYEVVRVVEGNETVLVKSTDKCEYIDDLDKIDPKEVSYKIITVSEDSESDPVEVEVTPDEIFVKYDQSKMTATACSKASDSREELADGPAENVLDGNDKTFWHTNYNGKEDVTLENGHHWIEIDLGGVYEVSYVTYLPRQNSPNGRITKYELIVTKEDNTTATFTGDLEDNTDEKILPLDKPTKIKKFRIHALAANGDTSGTHCTAAEINVYNNKIIELGDVDRGGSVDSTDVTKLQKVLAGYEVEDYNAVYSDVNGDDTVNIKDATRIQKAIVGIKPIEDNNPYLVS